MEHKREVVFRAGKDEVVVYVDDEPELDRTESHITEGQLETVRESIGRAERQAK